MRLDPIITRRFKELPDKADGVIAAREYEYTLARKGDGFIYRGEIEK
jgi:hypothetical protein